MNIPVVNFKSEWNANNSILKRSFSDKVLHITFFALQSVIRRVLLPASMYSNSWVKKEVDHFNRFWFGSPQDSNHFFRSHYTPTKIQVETPDGFKLSGYHFQHKDAQPSSDTHIYCQPNGGVSESGGYMWLLYSAILRRAPHNFVVFDYHGCSQSQGHARNKKDIVLAADSFLQYAQKKMQVASDKIHFYGFSLGGGVSVELKSLYPNLNGKLVNERSFASIHKVVKEFSLWWIVKKISTVFLKRNGWNLQPSKKFSAVQGEKRIVYERIDQVIPLKANLATSLTKKKLIHPYELIELDAKQHHFSNPHCTPITLYDPAGKPMPMTQVGDFLFGGQRPSRAHLITLVSQMSVHRRRAVYEIVADRFQNGGHYFGSGEDAFHQRNGQYISDEQAFATLERAF